MAANTTPKFWFDLDGNKYGARYMTIAEQVAAQVEIERHTNGKFAEWSRSGDVNQAAVAMMTQFAVFLNKVIVAWPAGQEPGNLLESDDIEYVVRLWEAYGEAANTFRERGRAAGSSKPVGEEVPASAVVP